MGSAGAGGVAGGGAAGGGGTGGTVTGNTPETADDAGADDAGAEAARTRLAQAPEALDLLEAPVDEARDLAARAEETLAEEAPLSVDGRSVPPDTCLAEAVGEALDGRRAGGVAVPARVEALTVGGEGAIAHVLVTAAPGAAALDRVEALVVDPDSCRVRLSVGP